jgi:2Fe-2S ferredoxin
MVKLVVITREGSELNFTAKTGMSVMQVIRENGIDEVQAVCGGCCSCATCHVYIDRLFTGVLPEIGENENDLLDSSDHRTDRSRLSCQLSITEELDGLRVYIAPED